VLISSKEFKKDLSLEEIVGAERREFMREDNQKNRPLNKIN
jgi:hypothetical protein